MTPVGWAAFGINIATALFTKSSSGAFEKAVLKALHQIQQQLNYIIERIDDLRGTVVEEFRELNEKIDLVYSTQLTTERESLFNDYQSATDALTDAMANGDRAAFFAALQRMRDIAVNRLDDPAITQFNPGSLRAETLTRTVTFGYSTAGTETACVDGQR